MSVLGSRMIQAMIDISSEHNASKNNQNQLFVAVLSWFHLAVTFRWSQHDLGVTPLWNQTPTDVIMCTWVGFRPIYWKCWSNNVVSTILRWFDLAMTFRWPYHDLGITPLWYPPPTHVTMNTWLGFRSIYFYTTLRVKGILLRWPLMTLSMHSKSADHLKVTWYIIRLKKYGLHKHPVGRWEGVQVGPRSKYCNEKTHNSPPHRS